MLSSLSVKTYASTNEHPSHLTIAHKQDTYTSDQLRTLFEQVIQQEQTRPRHPSGIRYWGHEDLITILQEKYEKNIPISLEKLEKLSRYNTEQIILILDALAKDPSSHKETNHQRMSPALIEAYTALGIYPQENRI